MTEKLVVSDEEVFELLAFHLSAARALVEEPPDYGPMRLLTAAQKLCAVAAARSADDTGLFASLAEQIPQGLRQRLRDPEGYVRFLDEMCTTVARALAQRAGREV